MNNKIHLDEIREVLNRPGFEGPQQLRGYIPCDLTTGGTANYYGGPNPERYVPMGISGVTIGTGVDLGQTDAATLGGMGVNPGIVNQLRPYLGQRKAAAPPAPDHQAGHGRRSGRCHAQSPCHQNCRLL